MQTDRVFSRFVGVVLAVTGLWRKKQTATTQLAPASQPQSGEDRRRFAYTTQPTSTAE